MPAIDPSIGRSLGNTRLIERLGQGAMGVVYRGYHLGFRKEVAVKLLLSHSQEKAASYRERFLREGQAAAKVRHENVVQVIDAGQDNGIAYLVMELVDGPSLGKILDTKGSLPPGAVIKLGIGICRGLAAIHAAGIIHRDIKPDNILIGSKAIPKITDLGLAKQYEDENVTRLTATGVVVGTPLYVSPEAIRDPRLITPASDVYSLGATLYHLATGQTPFPHATAYEVMRGHLEERVRPIREIAEHVPAGLAEIIERCLSKPQDKRPTAVELEQLLVEHSGAGRGRLSRGLALFVGGIALAVLLLGVTGFILLGRGRAAAAARRERELHAAATVTLLADAARMRVRIDGGEWQPVAGPLSLPAGSHQVAVEADQPGPLLQWQGAVEVAPGAARDLPVALSPVAVPPTRVPFDGAGMVFRDGIAWGTDAQVAFTKAGTYALARCDERGWISGTVAVDARGAHPSATSIAAAPAAAAYWRANDERGKPLTPHHVACWWEVERVRARSGLPQPIGWREQGQRPEQPAVRLNAALAGALAEPVKPYARLPDRAEALRLGRDLNASLWCSEGGRLDVVGDEAAAQIALLPAK